VAYADLSLQDDVMLNRMMLHADEALYEAKNAGRNRVCASPLEKPKRSKPTELRSIKTLGGKLKK